MKIIVVSDLNIAGQPVALTRAINKYTHHEARCIIWQDDYLSYDRDIIIRNQKGEASEEALSLAADVVQKAEFFHIGRQLIPLPNIKWENYLTPRNTVFQYFGSLLRDNGIEIAKFHRETRFKAITHADLTIHQYLPWAIYNIQPYMLEMENLPQAEMNLNGKLKVCHAPSSLNYQRLKRTDLILAAMERLQEELGTDSVLISDVPNKKCLELKSQCHLHLVALRFGLGLNSIESAGMGLVPVVQQSNFSRLVVDSPVPHATETTLFDVAKKLITDKSRLKALSAECREWAWREFDAKNLVKKYCFLYDLIRNGLNVNYSEFMKESNALH